MSIVRDAGAAIGPGAAATSDLAPLKGHRLALVLLLLAYTLSITDRMILSILFSPIKEEFGLTDTQLGLLGGLSFALLYATLGIPIARFADRGNRRMIIIISLTVFSVMTVLCGLAWGLISLIIFRIGVGIGEAGVNPSSQSIIADYFPPQRRAMAMSILVLGANFGMILGFISGGFISENYGWRAAMVAVGAPGVLLAVVMYFFLKDPPRGSFEQPAKTDVPPPIYVTAKFMWANRGMRHLIAASTVSAMLAYGMGQWLPAFFIRSHELTQSQVGMLMGLVFGLFGAAGALTGGKIADRLSIGGHHRVVWMIALTQMIGVPIMVLAFYASGFSLAVGLFILPAFLFNFYLGPSLALVQTLSPVRMRAVTAAIKMLCMNLVGLGLGPLLIGMLSDFLEPIYGENALRTALAFATALGFWAAFHFWLCGREILSASSPQVER
ncbi:MAG: MFS transporter [Rhodobiaceae bacterium]|nr:MFS transporter [Rhodobiaceae bacterium]